MGAHYQPLRITAYWQTPVVCDDRLPLDGVVLYFQGRERLGFQPSTQAMVNLSKLEGLPELFATRSVRTPQRRFTFPACSFACWGGVVAEGRDFWAKRFDRRESSLIDFGPQRGFIVTKSGSYKGYQMPLYTRHTLYARWYCVGAKAEIVRLLRHAQNLGKKVSQGYGAVLRWEVEEWPHDWSVESPRGLMRALPAGDGTGTLSGFRPSYWLPANQTRCRLPEAYTDPAA
jgi:hypothetical protein